MENEVLEELWKSKDEVAESHGYDIEKLAKALREKQKLESAEIVDLSMESARETTKS